VALASFNSYIKYSCADNQLQKLRKLEPNKGVSERGFTSEQHKKVIYGRSQQRKVNTQYINIKTMCLRNVLQVQYHSDIDICFIDYNTR